MLCLCCFASCAKLPYASVSIFFQFSWCISSVAKLCFRVQKCRLTSSESDALCIIRHWHYHTPLIKYFICFITLPYHIIICPIEKTNCQDVAWEWIPMVIYLVNEFFEPDWFFNLNWRFIRFFFCKLFSFYRNISFTHDSIAFFKRKSWIIHSAYIIFCRCLLFFDCSLD